MSHKPQALSDRFWPKVQILGENDCWNWIASANPRFGYGQIGCRYRELGMEDDRRTMARSHRVAWFLRNGAIPNGLMVLHRCDNVRCCNPTHLFLGTQKDNMQDALSKGRHGHGTVGGKRIHDPKVIQMAIDEYARGLSDYRSIAKRHGISGTHLLRHVKRNGVKPSYYHGLKPEQVIEIRNLYAAGTYTQPQLAEMFGCSRANIGLIVRRINWQRI
jgi:hypothetical protein